MVDLEWGSFAGGHVKCWERFAEAAAEFPALDLTIYYLGRKPAEVTIAPNVRYQLLPPVLGTHQFPFLNAPARNTDLAPYHPGLAKRLRQHQVLHITSAFSLSRTACKVAQQHQIPLVCSTHTDLPQFTRIYSQAIISRFLGTDWLRRLVFERWKLGERLERSMARQWYGLMQDCDWVLLSNWADQPAMQPWVPKAQLSPLRRGLDQQRFNPLHRDRDRLYEQFNIPADIPVLLFVGRVDDSKKVMTLAQATRHLLDAGHSLHVLVVGEGAAQPKVKALLGAQVTLPGGLPQSDLGWIYASADLFVFPSETEVSPNVVLEAKASGLPVFVAAHQGGAQFVARSGVDGVVVADSNPQSWAMALTPYLNQPELRSAMSQAARQHIEQNHPSWKEVLQADLLPIWQKAGRANRPLPHSTT